MIAIRKGLRTPTNFSGCSLYLINFLRIWCALKLPEITLVLFKQGASSWLKCSKIHFAVQEMSQLRNAAGAISKSLLTRSLFLFFSFRFGFNPVNS